MQRISRDHMFMEMAEIASMRGTCDRAYVGAVIVIENRPVSCGYNGAPPGHKHCTEVGHGDTLHEQIERYALGDLMGEGGTRQKIEACVDRLKRFIPNTGCTRAVHAEANAIAWAARSTISTFGATMYCTYSPCKTCAELILASGIGRFVYRNSYRAERLDLLNHIEVVQLNA